MTSPPHCVNKAKRTTFLSSQQMVETDLKLHQPNQKEKDLRIHLRKINKFSVLQTLGRNINQVNLPFIQFPEGV
jgi:hypothetical protein